MILSYINKLSALSYTHQQINEWSWSYTHQQINERSLSYTHQQINERSLSYTHLDHLHMTSTNKETTLNLTLVSSNGRTRLYSDGLKSLILNNGSLWISFSSFLANSETSYLGWSQGLSTQKVSNSQKLEISSTIWERKQWVVPPVRVSACLRVCVSACLRVCVSACVHAC